MTYFKLNHINWSERLSSSSGEAKVSQIRLNHVNWAEKSPSNQKDVERAGCYDDSCWVKSLNLGKVDNNFDAVKTFDNEGSVLFIESSTVIDQEQEPPLKKRTPPQAPSQEWVDRCRQVNSDIVPSIDK